MKIEKLNISRKVGLLDLFKDLDLNIGVEVGTDRAGYSKHILQRLQSVSLFTIDPYIPYNEGDEVKDEAKMQEIEKEARGILEEYKNATLLKMTSMDAVKQFEDNTLDFVFIDGNHEYEYVYEDIVEWTKKVKPGGIIVGHDYKKDDSRKYGVVEAVNRYAEEMEISHLYILEKGSFVPCWMFIKSWL